MNGEKFIHSALYALGLYPVKSSGHWTLVIITHTIAWLIFLTFPLIIYNVEIIDSRFFVNELVNKSFLVGLFYFNYLYLIPRFFVRKQFSRYYLSIVFILILLCVQHYFTTRFIRKPQEPFFRRELLVSKDGKNAGLLSTDSAAKFIVMQAGRFNGRPKIFAARIGRPPSFIVFIITHTAGSALLLIFVGGFIALAKSLLVNIQQKKELENEQLNAELSFLKAQINPHFLFNTLNGIYSLAHSKSDLTEQSILKLSQLLRYVLYDTGNEKIPLSKDLDYISNYIYLQKLRVSKSITINYEILGEHKQLLIAPLLLINFIENAFKHGISYTGNSIVDVKIKITGRYLALTVRNNITNNQQVDNQGGIGLINTKRRLDLLYAGKYMLDIQTDNQNYIVHLKIELDYENKVPYN
jgi:hypothetical protein